MPANIRELKCCIGFKRQSALQTPLAAADCWSLGQTNEDIGQSQPVVESNATFLGKGDEFATTNFKSHLVSERPWNGYLTSEAAAILATFGLPKFVKAAAGTGFSYTCEFGDPKTDGIELPSTTIVDSIRQGANDVHDQALIGMCLEEFLINLKSGPGLENATFTSQWVGCGKYVSPSNIAVPAAYPEHMLNAGGAATITLMGQDYLSTKTFNELTFGVRNNIRRDRMYYPGSGTQDGFQIGGRCEHGDRQAVLTWTADFEEGSPELGNLMALTEATAVVKVEGATIGAGPDKHALTATFHRVVLSTARLASNNGIVTVQCEATAMKHAVNGVLTVVVVCEQDNIGTVAV